MSADKRMRLLALSPLRWRSCRALLMLMLAQCVGCRACSRPKPRSLVVASPAPESSPAPRAEASDPCRRTALCVDFGRCSYRPVDANDPAYQWVPIATATTSIGVAYFSCVASTDADCQRSRVACSEQGDCAARGGVCVATDDTHCAASQWCKLGGLCSAVDGWCQRDAKSACAGSAVCRAAGLCSDKAMPAARIGDMFFASRESLIADPERRSKDLWAIPETLVDPHTFVVAQQLASIQACVVQRSQDCRASDACREQGLCVAEEGECVHTPTSTRHR